MQKCLWMMRICHHQQPEPDLDDDPIELGSGGDPPPAPPGGGTFVPVPEDDSPDEPPVHMQYHDEALPPGGPPGAPGAVPQFSNPDQVLSPPMPWPAPATPICSSAHTAASAVSASAEFETALSEECRSDACAWRTSGRCFQS